MTTASIWERSFDNSPRHCWPLRDGSRVRDGSDLPCALAHTRDPQLVGNVSWRRFIAAAIRASVAAGLLSPFTGDDEDFALHLTGKSPSLETYSRAGHEIACILVDSTARTALVRLADPVYLAAFTAASAEVDRQYREREL